MACFPSVSFRAVSAHGILTPRALTIETSCLNYDALVMLTKRFYLVVNYRKQFLLACLSECYIPMKETFQTHVFNVNLENSSKFAMFPIFVLVPYCELNIDFAAFFLTGFLLMLIRVQLAALSREISI